LGPAGEENRDGESVDSRAPIRESLAGVDSIAGLAEEPAGAMASTAPSKPASGPPCTEESIVKSTNAATAAAFSNAADTAAAK
jgi:hypothetical protein